MQRVHIVGGGLAGLSLGLLLRRAGVPVTVFEAGRYPRHRVCGEFVSGIAPGEIEALGLAEIFSTAPRHETSAWFVGDRFLFAPRLPQPAVALSRHRLDAALAEKFSTGGGELLCGERIDPSVNGEGWVAACGRVRGEPRWFGLKAHYHELPLAAGLEVHLGRGGYAGLTAIENGTVNVCALLPAERHRTGTPGNLLPERLAEIGLCALAERLSRATIDRSSLTGVSHFTLAYGPGRGNSIRLGDCAAMIAPFTGNGMSMAFQGALVAARPVMAWSRGEISWAGACLDVSREMRRSFRRRMCWSARLHPLLLGRGGQALFRALAAIRAVPFRWLFERLR